MRKVGSCAVRIVYIKEWASKKASKYQEKWDLISPKTDQKVNINSISKIVY